MQLSWFGRYKLVGLVVLSLGFLAGCQHANQSALSKPSSDLIMQTSRDYPVYKRVAFDAVVGALQQAGYHIQERHYEEGQLLASLNLRAVNGESASDVLQLKAYIVSLAPQDSMVRLQLSSLQEQGRHGEKRVTRINQPEAYQQLFAGIDSTIAIRLGKGNAKSS